MCNSEAGPLHYYINMRFSSESGLYNSLEPGVKVFILCHSFDFDFYNAITQNICFVKG